MAEQADNQKVDPDELTRRPDLRDEDDHHNTTQLELISVVSDKEARKLEARRTQNGSVWFGLGMFGMIGWSVAAPTLLCVALGIWIDSRWDSRFSWTLMLLLLGMAMGCLNAWFWLRGNESRLGSGKQWTVNSE